MSAPALGSLGSFDIGSDVAQGMPSPHKVKPGHNQIGCAHFENQMECMGSCCSAEGRHRARIQAELPHAVPAEGC